MKKKDLERLFLIDEFTIKDVDYFLSNNNISAKDIVIHICDLVNHWKEKSLYKHREFILSSIKFLSFLCNNYNFTDDDIKIFKKRFNKIKVKLENAYDRNSCGDILKAIEILNDIYFIKRRKIENLERVIERLIDRNEEIFIIENIIDLDKSCLVNNNYELFDYTFNKLLSTINSESFLNNYYISLLKIFYNKNIDYEYYIKLLDKYKNSELYYEVYGILSNSNMILSSKELLAKYCKDIKPPYYELNTFYKTIKNRSRIFTIDNYKTLRRDDALSIKKDGNNYLVQVYISDIVPSIEYGSEVDKMALTLFKNSYFYTRDSIEIFNEGITNNLSLNSNQKRNVITLNFIFDSSLSLKDYFVSSDTILIAHNYDYMTVEKILNNRSYNSEYASFLTLKLITDELRNQNREKEKYWKQKSKKRSIQKNKVYNSSSHDIISELSILYGKSIASLCDENNIPCIYRNQDKTYIPEIFNEENVLLSKEEYNEVSNLYLFPYYSLTPGIHYGLNTEKYVQATNALRKYPDGYMQRLLHKYYFKDIDFDDSNIENLIDYFNIRSQDTNIFEDEYIMRLKNRY